MFLCLFVLILLSQSLMVITESISNYGPYKIIWSKFETCKGPKPSECGVLHTENTQNMSDVQFFVKTTKDCPLTMAKVMLSSKQPNNTTKRLVNYFLKRPCQHFVLGPILMEAYNLTKTTGCKIKKGDIVAHLNMHDKTYMFLGKNFFYGHYLTRVTAYNKINNFFCVDAEFKIIKKTFSAD